MKKKGVGSDSGALFFGRSSSICEEVGKTNDRTRRIYWKVGRARFVLFLPLGLLLSAFSIFLLLDGQLLALGLLGLFLFLTAWAAAGIIWPPEIEVSEKGVWFSKWGKIHAFDWTDLEGPVRGPIVGIRQTLKLTVRSTGKEVLIAPSLFDSSYDQLASIMDEAKTQSSSS